MVACRNYKLLCLLLSALLGVFLSLAFPGCDQDRPPTPLLSDCIDSTEPPIDIKVAGMDGIVLKVDATCKFQIDAQNSTRLRWSTFVEKYGNVHPRIKIKVSINENGGVDSVHGIKDGGFPDAADWIRRRVLRWQYTGGCLKGDIYFDFNTQGSRIYMDTTRLERSPRYRNCEVVTGRLHRIIRGSHLGIYTRALQF